MSIISSILLSSFWPLVLIFFSSSCFQLSHLFCCLLLIHYVSSLLFFHFSSSSSFYLLSSFLPVFRWMKRQQSRSPRPSSALVSFSGSSSRRQSFTLVLNLHHVVLADIHGVEVCFLQSSMQCPGGTSSKLTMWLTWGTGWLLSTRPARLLWVMHIHRHTHTYTHLS